MTGAGDGSGSVGGRDGRSGERRRFGLERAEVVF
jgi:hypothetical protein